MNFNCKNVSVLTSFQQRGFAYVTEQINEVLGTGGSKMSTQVMYV